jgi:hypothetical protein
MNYSTEETRDDEDRQSKVCEPEVSHPRSVTYGSFYCVRSYALADWMPTCQVPRNGDLSSRTRPAYPQTRFRGVYHFSPLCNLTRQSTWAVGSWLPQFDVRTSQELAKSAPLLQLGYR